MDVSTSGTSNTGSVRQHYSLCQPSRMHPRSSNQEWSVLDSDQYGVPRACPDCSTHSRCRKLAVQLSQLLMPWIKERGPFTRRFFRSLVAGGGHQMWASQLHRKLYRFVVRSRNPQAFAVGILVTQWVQFCLIYAFPSLKLFPQLLRSPVILVAPNWPINAGYRRVCYLTDSPWPLRDCTDLDFLSYSPFYDPAFCWLTLMA